MTNRDQTLTKLGPREANCARTPWQGLDHVPRNREHATPALQTIPLALRGSGFCGALVIEPAARRVVTRAVLRARRPIARKS